MAKAAPSDKLVTLPNLISLAGFLLVAHGLYGRKRGLDTPLGAAEVAVGKALDLLDGLTARHLLDTAPGQTLAQTVGADRLCESTFGAKLDPVLDTVGNAMLGAEAWRKNLVPKTILATVAITEALKSGATVYDQLAHPATADARRPINAGRHGSFLVNLSIFIFLAKHFCRPRQRAGSVLSGCGWALFAAGMAMKLGALKTYLRRALGQE